MWDVKQERWHRFLLLTAITLKKPSRGRILEWNSDKSLKSFPPCYLVSSTALPWDFYFFKFTQPISTVQLLYTVKEKGGKPDRKPHHLPYGLRNPYRNLKYEKQQRNCTFMNSASVLYSLSVYTDVCYAHEYKYFQHFVHRTSILMFSRPVKKVFNIE